MRTTTRAVPSQAQKPNAKAAVKPPAPEPAAPVAKDDKAAAPVAKDDEAAAPVANDDEAAESGEPPQTIKESGKRLARTAKKVVNQNGAGVLNGVTRMLKAANGSFNFFGNLLQNHSKNAKDLAKKSFEAVSSIGDNAAKGTGHLIDSARTIGGQGSKSMRSVLDKGTALGVSVTKFGGTAIGAPMSIAEDVISTGHQLVKIPSRMSKAVAKNYIKPLLNFSRPDSEENEDQEDDAAPPSPPPTQKPGAKPTKK